MATDQAPDAVTDPPDHADVAPPEDIDGFDPRHDSARTVNGGKVKQVYQNLCRRGKYEAADRLRQESTVRKQLDLGRTFPEFHPAHDPRNTVSKIRVGKTFDWLVENGHETEADTLAGLETLREQVTRAREYQYRHGVTIPDV